MAKAIFLHDETDEFRSLAVMNPGVFASSICSRLDVLKMKYRKQNALLGQTGAGCTYEDLLSNDKTKNILAAITKDFPWWANLHGWWRTNPAYNNTFSAADIGQDFATRAVKLFKLQPTPPVTDPEFQPASLSVRHSSTPSRLEDGEIEDDEDFSGSADSQVPWDHQQKAASVPVMEESSDSDVVPSNYFSTLRVSSSSPSSPFISDDSDSKPSKQTQKRVCETPADQISNSLSSASMSFVQHFQQSQQERSQVKRHRLDLDYWKAQVKVTVGQEEWEFQLLTQHKKYAHELVMGEQEVRKMELAVKLEQLRAQNLTLQRGIAGGEDQGASGDKDVHSSPPSV
ncbi:hypothetical protein EDD17DRAFT_1512595 [Pisolithus thermaeus]|nr:hypothetical protein EDD17DRAFT_1512595 [Pisolithus thermaeus]